MRSISASTCAISWSARRECFIVASTAFGASAPTADVQVLVELLIQLLLLGIEIRHLPLLGLLCCRAWRKRLRPRLQMADRRAGHSGRRACDWLRVGRCCEHAPEG